MRKLKLQIDNLEVESFDTSEIRTRRGTVLGASGIEPAPESVLPGECDTGAAYTGPCCGYSLVISCGTNCDEGATCGVGCAVVDTNTCIE
jgi:hypothetical protein